MKRVGCTSKAHKAQAEDQLQNDQDLADDIVHRAAPHKPAPGSKNDHKNFVT
jgi:hypothetical protein